MKPMFNITELELITSGTKLPFECETCSNIFYVKAGRLKFFINNNTLNNRFSYCSDKCKYISRRRYEDEYDGYNAICGVCSIPIKANHSNKKNTKCGKNFCSHSCSTSYHNKHKTTGTNRSKLEAWIELELTRLYPQIFVLYNDRKTINAELDIYIPSINLAFELNGIFHYEPIWGINALNAVQNNDNRKFQACLEHHIELVIIDSSSLKMFKPNKAAKYLKIITDIIDQKLKL